MSRSLLLLLVACGPPIRPERGDAPGGKDNDAASGGGDSATTDTAGTGDGSTGSQDASVDGGSPGVITGGPCMSGNAGATAYRMRWANSAGTAYAVYEVNGLPDKSRDHAGAFGYQIGFTPSYVDPFLAQGGLQLDGNDFIDVEISTVGVAHISRAMLAIYGRSYNTTASGSFNWQTFDGVGETATNAVSNVAPYAWYSGDMTTEISPGDGTVLIRIKAGPSSDALVVNRVELCLQAS